MTAVTRGVQIGEFRKHFNCDEFIDFAEHPEALTINRIARLVRAPAPLASRRMVRTHVRRCKEQRAQQCIGAALSAQCT